MANPISPRQSSVGRANPYRSNPAYRIHYPIEGNIVGVHLPNDAKNRSKREVEYDVQPTIVTMGRILNVPLGLGVHGVVDAEEVLLRPASLLIPNGPFDANTANPSQTDGDRVLVQFINGSFLNPIITHVLTHNAQGRAGANQAPQFDGVSEILIADDQGYKFGDGSTGSTAAKMAPEATKRLRHSSLNGTHLAVDTDGNVFVNFKAHPDKNTGITAGNVTKKLVIQNEGQDLIRLEKSGNTVNLVFGETEGLNFILSLGDGSLSVAIAEKLKTFYNTLKGKLDSFDGHTHIVPSTGFISGTPGNPVTGVGVTQGPTPTVAAPTWDDSIASATAKLQG